MIITYTSDHLINHCVNFHLMITDEELLNWDHNKNIELQYSMNDKIREAVVELKVNEYNKEKEA